MSPFYNNSGKYKFKCNIVIHFILINKQKIQNEKPRPYI